MNNRLYVGNLNFKTTEEDLEKRFSEAGEVTSAEIIKDSDSGESRGFGFVEMKTEEEAKKAVKIFHEKEFEGRELTVEEAKPKKESSDTPLTTSSNNEYVEPDLDEDGMPYMR